MSRQTATPAGLVARFLENVRLVKSLRRLTDDEVAEGGGYRSRQVLNARLSGRTTPDLDDVARIAAALDVAPEVMFLPIHEVMSWIDQNPKYKAPKQPNPTKTRVRRKQAVKAAPATKTAK